MAETMTHYDLLEAFERGSCPICSLTLKAVARYIAAVNYEAVGDPGIRKQLRASLGFCNEHAHQWLHAAFVLGTAKIYANVLENTTSQLRDLTFRRHGLFEGMAARFGGGAQGDDECAYIEPAASCLACDIRDSAEGMAVAALVRGLDDPAFRAAYVASAGLCLPHLRLALCRITNEAGFTTLRDAALAREERLLAQLNEIARKHDYRYGQEPSGEEKGAGERAVNHVIGAPGIGCCRSTE